MRKAVLKCVIAGIAVAVAVTYLAYAGITEGWVSYHMTVDQFRQDPKHAERRVRLAGWVSPDDLVAGTGKLGASFNLTGETHQVPVVYRGVLPDMFKPGCEVVVEGRLDSAGVFQAESLMTKCASKYDEAGHGKDKSDPTARSAS